MRRADRLFEIIQLLRRARRCGRATSARRSRCRSARSTATSSDLMASGVPIEGEAGVGYVLRAGFDLPPLMFKEQEIEALVLGRADRRVLGRFGARDGGSRRARQDRGGDPRPAAGLYGEHRPAGAAASFHGADLLRLAALRRAVRKQIKVHFSTKMRPDMRRKEPFGRCPWRISDRSGCSPPGASSGSTSGPSASTGSTGSGSRPSASGPSPAAP